MCTVIADMKMRIINKSFEKTTEHYNQISEFEQKNHLKSQIETGLQKLRALNFVF